MVQVTYQKSNGSVIQRLRKTMVPYKIGDTTSMGWKVMNIEFEHNNKFYPEYKYLILINKEIKAHALKQQIRERFAKEMKLFLYYFIAAMVISIVRKAIGI